MLRQWSVAMDANADKAFITERQARKSKTCIKIVNGNRHRSSDQQTTMTRRFKNMNHKTKQHQESENWPSE